MDDDRILAIQVKHADLQRRAVAGRAGPMSMVRSSSMSIFLMAVRTACQMYLVGEALSSLRHLQSRSIMVV